MPRERCKNEVSPGANIPCNSPLARLSELAPLIAATGRALHARGWAFATSGNFSAVVRREPLVLAISRSGVDKGRLSATDILEVDGNGLPLEADARPSDETVVHLAVVHERGAGAVLHTHSVWNTLLSEAAGDAGFLRLSGYEMLKGLAGVTSHEHEEWLPDPGEHAGLRPDVARRQGGTGPAPRRARPAAARPRALHVGPRSRGSPASRRGARVPVRSRGAAPRRHRTAGRRARRAR